MFEDPTLRINLEDVKEYYMPDKEKLFLLAANKGAF